MKAIDANAHPANHTIIDRDALMSQCHIWQWQRHHYQQPVETIWNNLPYGTSSNTVQAHAYAHHIEQVIQDGIEHHGREADDPFYVIELGAGHGLLSYLIMQAIERLGLYERYPKLQHVLLDQAPARLTHWREIEAFKQAETNQRLDFAVGNVKQLNRTILVNQQVPLQQIIAQHPSVIIMHYLLDSLPTNTYYTDGDGMHHEVRYTISSPAENLDARMRPKSMQPLVYSTSLNPIPEKPYHEQHLNHSLTLCLKQQKPEQYCHFPMSAIALLEQLNNTQQPSWIHIQDIFDHSDTAFPFSTKHPDAWYQAVDPRWIQTWRTEQTDTTLHTTKVSNDLTWIGLAKPNMPASSQGITRWFYRGMTTALTKAITENADTPMEVLLEAIETYHDSHLLMVTLEQHEAYFRAHPDILCTVLEKAPKDLAFLPQKNRCGYLLIMYYHHLNQPQKALHYYEQLSKDMREAPAMMPHALWCAQQNHLHTAYRRLKRQHHKQRLRRRWHMSAAWLHLQSVRIRRAIIWMTLPIALVLYIKGVGFH